MSDITNIDDYPTYVKIINWASHNIIGQYRSIYLTPVIGTAAYSTVFP